MLTAIFICRHLFRPKVLPLLPLGCALLWQRQAPRPHVTRKQPRLSSFFRHPCLSSTHPNRMHPAQTAPKLSPSFGQYQQFLPRLRTDRTTTKPGSAERESTHPLTLAKLRFICPPGQMLRSPRAIHSNVISALRLPRLSTRLPPPIAVLPAANPPRSNYLDAAFWDTSFLLLLKLHRRLPLTCLSDAEPARMST